MHDATKITFLSALIKPYGILLPLGMGPRAAIPLELLFLLSA